MLALLVPGVGMGGGGTVLDLRGTYSDAGYTVSLITPESISGGSRGNVGSAG